MRVPGLDQLQSQYAALRSEVDAFLSSTKQVGGLDCRAWLAPRLASPAPQPTDWDAPPASCEQGRTTPEARWALRSTAQRPLVPAPEESDIEPAFCSNEHSPSKPDLPAAAASTSPYVDFAAAPATPNQAPASAARTLRFPDPGIPGPPQAASVLMRLQAALSDLFLLPPADLAGDTACAACIRGAARQVEAYAASVAALQRGSDTDAPA